MTTKTLEQTTTTKGSKVVVEQVKQLTEVRAEIARLEKQKEALTAEIEKAFGVDKKAKTSNFITLTHNGIEFARVDWRSRKGIDSEKLAVEFPEAYEACQKPTIYSVIVSLFK
jgi:predicted phage-related endonuclease